MVSYADQHKIYRFLLATTKRKVPNYSTSAELKKIFSSMKTRSLWAILRSYPFPQDVLRFELSTIREIISKSSYRKAQAAKKARDLYEAANASIGLK